MNVRDPHAALALGAALMVTQWVVTNGAATAQTTSAAKKQSGTHTTARTAPKSRTARTALPPTRASRTRVSINAKNAPVQTVMERMFRDAKAEYIMDNGVAGNVTLRVANQPFETALALLLRASSSPLTYSRDGNVYVIHSARRNTTSAGASGTALVSNIEPTDPAFAEQVPVAAAPPGILPQGVVSTPLGIVTNSGVTTYSPYAGAFGPSPVTISPSVPSNNGFNNNYFSPYLNTGAGPLYNGGTTYFASPWFGNNNGYYFPYYGHGN